MGLARQSLAAGAAKLDVNAARAILQYGEELKKADAGQWDGTGACPTCGYDDDARTVFVIDPPPPPRESEGEDAE